MNPRRRSCTESSTATFPSWKTWRRRGTIPPPLRQHTELVIAADFRNRPQARASSARSLPRMSQRADQRLPTLSVAPVARMSSSSSRIGPPCCQTSVRGTAMLIGTCRYECPDRTRATRKTRPPSSSAPPRRDGRSPPSPGRRLANSPWSAGRDDRASRASSIVRAMSAPRWHGEESALVSNRVCTTIPSSASPDDRLEAARAIGDPPRRRSPRSEGPRDALQRRRPPSWCRSERWRARDRRDAAPRTPTPPRRRSGRPPDPPALARRRQRRRATSRIRPRRATPRGEEAGPRARARGRAPPPISPADWRSPRRSGSWRDQLYGRYAHEATLRMSLFARYPLS